MPSHLPLVKRLNESYAVALLLKIRLHPRDLLVTKHRQRKRRFRQLRLWVEDLCVLNRLPAIYRLIKEEEEERGGSRRREEDRLPAWRRSLAAKERAPLSQAPITPFMKSMVILKMTNSRITDHQMTRRMIQVNRNYPSLVLP